MVNYDPHRWLDHFFDIRGSMVREILWRVAACVVWSAMVVAGFQYGWKVAIPSTLHSLVGLALGMLLVFRTNASYDRFWEGRKLWGGMVNETRNLVRMCQAHFGGQDRALVTQITQWTAAFPYAAMQSLRSATGLAGAEKFLTPEQIKLASSARHPGLAIAQEISGCLVKAHRLNYLTPHVLVAIDQNIQLLVDYLGGCERIRKTPLPFAYVVHLRRALVAYCFTLPFALVDTFGWTTVLDVMLVAYIFFGIEEIGVEIEGPFGYDDNDLPLEQICDTIRQNVADLAGISLAGIPMPSAVEDQSGAL
jgi:ion channel-forming bestrophin family protein